MMESAASVCFGRAHRFSAVIAGEAAIWDLSVEVAGVPDAQSGMVVSLPFVDQCLREAASELQRGVLAPQAVAADIATKIKKVGAESILVKVALDSGNQRQVLLVSSL